MITELAQRIKAAQYEQDVTGHANPGKTRCESFPKLSFSKRLLLRLSVGSLYKQIHWADDEGVFIARKQ